MAFFYGTYFAVTLITFVVILFFAILGGKESDLWKPFVYAPLWPVIFPYELVKSVRRRRHCGNN